MSALLLSAAASVVGAVASMVARGRVELAKRLACAFGVVAAVLAVAAGLQGVFGSALFLSVATPFSFAGFSLLLNPLAGVMLVVINVLALVAWVYGLSYFDEYADKGMGAIGMFMNLFVVSMNFVITCDNAFWFLVFFELMSLTSYFLVIIEQNQASVRGGFMYFVMAHVGFFMIMVAYLIMAAQTGSLEFADFRATAFSPATAGVVFLLGFAGFGCKAGMVPFHSWLPQAHPAAPSNVSALMSGGMIKIGVFGIVKVGLDLLASSEVALWWGVVVVLVGAASSVLGVVYALAEHDIKKLLAYHSVENVGIILLGVGFAYVGVACDQPALAALALMAGLYHLVNHAMFKGLLFLGAGGVLYSTGTRNMELMGGLGHAMPVTGACFLIGSLAISAIPPLNGFVSEWFTYQAMFSAAIQGSLGVQAVAALCCLALAITGALAVTCFVKAYGVTFLGTPRSDAARAAGEVPTPMRAAMVVLAAVCVLLGLCAPWVAPSLQGVASSVLATDAVAVACGAAIANPVLGGAISTPLVAALLAVAFLLVVAVRRACATGGERADADPWACGYAPAPDMPVVATTFAAQVRMFLGPLYDLRDGVVGLADGFRTGFARLVECCAKAETVGDRTLVAGTSSLVAAIGRLASRLEGGNFRRYVVYIVVALVFFLCLVTLMN